MEPPQLGKQRKKDKYKKESKFNVNVRLLIKKEIKFQVCKIPKIRENAIISDGAKSKIKLRNSDGRIGDDRDGARAGEENGNKDQSGRVSRSASRECEDLSLIHI